MTKRATLPLGLLGLCLIATTAWAQPTTAARHHTDVNRMVEAVSVAASTDGRTSPVTAFFSVGANTVDGPIDLSTDVLFVVNGQQVARQQFDIVAYPPVTPAFGCNCQPWEMCVVVDGFPVGCQDSFLACDPGNLFLREGDQLDIRIQPASGAATDTELRDDRGTVTYQGAPLLAVGRTCVRQESAIQSLGSSCLRE